LRGAQDALFSIAWLEAAQRQEPQATHDGLLFTAGIDVAGPGEDETVLAIRRGDNIIEIRSFPHSDARGELTAALLPYKGRLAVVTRPRWKSRECRLLLDNFSQAVHDLVILNERRGK
jgi:hypothetical protein